MTLSFDQVVLSLFATYLEYITMMILITLIFLRSLDLQFPNAEFVANIRADSDTLRNISSDYFALHSSRNLYDLKLIVIIFAILIHY